MCVLSSSLQYLLYSIIVSNWIVHGWYSRWNLNELILKNLYYSLFDSHFTSQLWHLAHNANSPSVQPVCLHTPTHTHLGIWETNTSGSFRFRTKHSIAGLLEGKTTQAHWLSKVTPYKK